MLQLVHSLHTSSFYSTRVLLTRFTRTAVDAACTISARLEPLLDPRGPGAYYLCHQCCSLCTLRTPRAFTRPVCSWPALLVPPMMQLVHSSYASSFYSTRVLLARTTRTTDNVACAISKRLEPLLDQCSLAGTNCPADATTYAVSERLGLLLGQSFLAGASYPADATACAVSDRLGPLLDPSSLAGTNYPIDTAACAVSKRLEPLLDQGSLARTSCPTDATACAVSEHIGPLLDPGSLAGTNCLTDTTAYVVMTRYTIFQFQQSCDS